MDFSTGVLAVNRSIIARTSGNRSPAFRPAAMESPLTPRLDGRAAERMNMSLAADAKCWRRHCPGDCDLLDVEVFSMRNSMPPASTSSSSGKLTLANRAACAGAGIDAVGYGNQPS